MTNPLTNIAGVYKLTVRRISFDTGFNIDTINHIFGKFEKAGKAFLRHEYLILPSWPKHQKWEKSKKIKAGIESILLDLNSEIIQELIDLGYKYPIGTLLNPMDTVSEGKPSFKGDSDTQYIPYTYPSNYIDSDSDIDSDIDKDSDSYGVLSEVDEPSLPTEPPIITIPRLGGSEVVITQSQIDMFSDAYPAVNIHAELKKMKAWLMSNKARQKKDVLRFINNWLSKTQDDAIKPKFNKSPPDKPSQRNLGNTDRWEKYYAEEEAKNAKQR